MMLGPDILELLLGLRVRKPLKVGHGVLAQSAIGGHLAFRTGRLNLCMPSM
jgi:hypothetical protein